MTYVSARRAGTGYELVIDGKQIPDDEPLTITAGVLAKLVVDTGEEYLRSGLEVNVPPMLQEVGDRIAGQVHKDSYASGWRDGSVRMVALVSSALRAADEAPALALLTQLGHLGPSATVTKTIERDATGQIVAIHETAG